MYKSHDAAVQEREPSATNDERPVTNPSFVVRPSSWVAAIRQILILVVSMEKAQRELGWRPRYTTATALESFLGSQVT